MRERFLKKNRRQVKNNLEQKKQLKEKEISNVCQGYGNSFNGWIDKKDTISNNSVLS